METYVECMVKRKTNGPMNALRIMMIILTVLSFIAGSIGHFIFMIVTIVIGFATYFVHLNTKLEYEYLYVDRQLTIDKIMAQQSRKKMETFDLDRMEILAPIKSWHLENYKNRQLKESDYSRGYEEKPDKRYVLIYNDRKIIFEPNQEMVQAIKSIAPRKVFTD